MGNKHVGLELVEVPLETLEVIEVPWRQRSGSIVKLLCDFLESGMVLAEVKHGYKNVMSARASFANALKRGGLTGKVRVISRIDRIFLLRLEE